VKWPNDIYVGSKKVAGVLIEMAAELDRVKWVTVSTGINVNNNFNGSPLEGSATSLRRESGRRVSRIEIAIAFLSNLDIYYAMGLSGGAAESIRSDFVTADMLQGNRVDVQTPTGSVSGTATGLDVDGRLLVTKDDGEVHSLFSGEATLATA
jgi:BirA family biotin operon repressor/biotin-[acetyl-CoA-carboxylase] ligase